MWSKTEYNDYVQDTAYLMQRWLQKQTHIADHLCTFELKHIRADWSKKRRSSRGGWYRSHNGPGISIAMHHTCRPTNGQVLRWYEYSSFDKSEVIGGFYYTDPVHALQGVVAHEVAHAAQYHRYYTTNESRDKPHGRIFKLYYHALRKHCVNPTIENQPVLLVRRSRNIKAIAKQEGYML